MRQTKVMMIMVVSLLCAISFHSGYAQNSQPSMENDVLYLSLQEAEQMAIERNNTLKNATYDIKAAQAQKWVAISSMLPQISASVDYSNMLGYKMDLGAMQIAMPANATLGASAAWAFSGAMVINAKISDISVKMSDINLQKTEQDIRSQVKQLYFSALVSQQIISLLEQNVESMNSMYNMTLKSVEVGVAEQTSADQLAVQVGTLKNTLSSTRRSLEMVYNTLRLLLNVESNTQFVLTQQLEEVLDLDTYVYLINQNFNLEDNNDYKLLKESTELSKQQLNAAKWSVSPTLTAFYQYSYKHYFTDEMRMNMTPPNMVGVTLSIPIFSSLGKTKTVQAAKFNYEKALNTFNDTQRSLIINHQQLRYDLTNSYENYVTQKENLDVTQKVYNNIKAKYEKGFASAMEMTTTTTTLLSAQSAYIQAVMSFVTAQINLQKLLNK